MDRADVRLLLAAGGMLAGYVLLVGIVPWLVPVDETLPNAAARQGYNLGSVFPTVLIWTLVGGGAIAVARHVSLIPATPSDERLSKADAVHPRRRLLEIALAALVALVLFFPPFLAPKGPYTEDVYFLHVLLRMACGAAPYTDFEFLYGPLMATVLSGWGAVFGISMQSHYWLIAVANASFLAGFLWWLQDAVPDNRRRLLIFVVLLPALADLLLGLNYIPWRRMLPVFALLVVASGPFDWRRVAGSAALLSVSAAYSYEFGALGLIATGAVYGILLLTRQWRQSLVYGPALAALTMVGSVALSAILTGASFSDYLASVFHVTEAASELGLGGFAFYWTPHSLSIFALLALGVTMLVSGVMIRRPEMPTARDLLLVGAVAFGIVGLRIAFQRADLWHMTMPMIPLTLALLLPGERRWFPLSPPLRLSAVGASASAALFAAAGLFPVADDIRKRWVGGAVASFGSSPVTALVDLPETALLSEQANPAPHVAELSALLADEDRPVFFYASAWELAAPTGICPTGYIFYDIPYSDGFRSLEDELAALSDPIVVIRERDLLALREGGYPKRRERRLRLRDRAVSWLASVHIKQRKIENDIEHELWRDMVGTHIIQNYRERTRLGDYIVLERNGRVEPSP